MDTCLHCARGDEHVWHDDGTPVRTKGERMTKLNEIIKDREVIERLREAEIMLKQLSETFLAVAKAVRELADIIEVLDDATEN